MRDSLKEAVQLSPYFARALWGGTLMQECWRPTAPFQDTSESWEVSAHPTGMSVIMDGPMAGKTLSEYIAAFSNRDFYGRDEISDFPMLIKVIAPEKDLSVQVHPDDAAARRMTGGRGKTEAWVILQAPKGAQIIYGLDCTAADFAHAVSAGDIVSSLRSIPVRAGDVIDIPAGMMHALTSGVIVYEIQQSCDTTYRVYDWDRVDAEGKSRPLHIAEALEVLKDFPPYKGPVKGYSWREGDAQRTALLCHHDFALERLSINGAWSGSLQTCYAITVTAGQGTLTTVGKSRRLQRGQSWIGPTCAETMKIQGECTLLMGSVLPWSSMREWVLSHGAREKDLDSIAGWRCHE